MADIHDLTMVEIPKGYSKAFPDLKRVLSVDRSFLEVMRQKSEENIAEIQKTREEGYPERVELSKEDLKELAERFDPNHMSQEEYDEFIDFLLDKGYLRQEETLRIGYHGVVCFRSQSEMSACYITDAKDALPYIGVGLSLTDLNGDVLAKCRLSTLWKTCHGAPEAVAAAEDTKNAFQAMAKVLESMKSYRSRAGI